MDLKQKLNKATEQLQQELNAGREKVKEDLHLLRPIMILPFYGYGSDSYAFLKGRVMEKDKKQDDKEEENSGEQSLSMLRRFALSAIPHIKLSASFAGMHQEVETNQEGYFEIEFKTDSPIDYQKAGHCVKLELLECKTGEDEMETEGHLFVPEKDARFCVISDIDDTVLVSNATSFLGQLKQNLLQDAQERSPFPGIAALLQALKGSNNPLFYVSSSQWNLYSFLVSFLEAHDVPKGPLLLHDKADNHEKINERQHKLNQISNILRTYPHMSFILIGDSGKDDPEIYRQLAQDFPNQVLCIYIRDVTDDGRADEVHKICLQVKKRGVEMLLVEDSAMAAQHAFRHGWISLPQLHQVQQNNQEQQNNDE
ncbi:App1 family protein [Pontibacter toksunensis]|uniref:App1 family protein n=1 Tax=Pontibacter toksunensis TaxID=1332631 RepID=A0ABW6BSZ6_9BACT